MFAFFLFSFLKSIQMLASSDTDIRHPQLCKILALLCLAAVERRGFSITPQAGGVSVFSPWPPWAPPVSCLCFEV